MGTKILYMNTLIYYLISFVGPFYYVAECGAGIHSAAHFWYMGYSILNLLSEAYFVYKINRQLSDKFLLDFSRWHIVEMVMGQIARFDFYTDICFFVMLL
jgi:hypothetical protein